jgi:DNA-binding transcriptional MerR regulator
VQQRLIPPPLGRGRGRHYDRSHLDRLRRIGELQAAGHSLDAIRRILEGDEGASAGVVVAPRRPPRASLSAELWTRLRFGEGVELHFDASRHDPTVEQLMQLRDAVRAVFREGDS